MRPLEDCLYALKPNIPRLTRSSLHHCLQHHSISRLPEVQETKAPESKKKFKNLSIPSTISISVFAEVHRVEGKLYMFVVIDKTSKLVFDLIPSQNKKNDCRLSFAQPY